MSVITRFAPSPTGMLHIGGARTALFNYLFAKRHNGKFLLRIEDTDRARSSDEATAAILEGMEWLGLTPDAPPVMQFDQAARHTEIALDMIARGTAFRCYATPEELQARRDLGEEKRQAAKADGVSEDAKAALLAEANELLAPYRSPWRDGAPAPSEDAPYTVRLRAPDGGDRILEDGVQGRVTIQASELDDMILLRSDGTPTYMLAVVVDDHDMGVTHVIRGDDHLNNAFRQLAIIKAMGWEEPVYAHIPLIHGSDGAKLSKRHGALGVDAYRDDMGMLPEAVLNYLLRLGWGHGDEEIIPIDRAIELFDIAGVGRSPSRFDIKKLENLNGHYLREADDARLAALVAPRLESRLDTQLNDGQRDILVQAMASLKPRAKTLNEIAEGAEFLFKSCPLDFDEKASALLDEPARALLTKTADALQSVPSWTVEAIEDVIRRVAEDAGLGLGKVAQPLRAALTGRTVSPGIFDVLFLLGKEESLERLTAAGHAAAG